ncbi:MAG: peptidylprolyl isomerase [Candidatus Kapabacteria bacterium]|nr:peptidylprolyl isomerase [Candidatus Kapabacteria bacterium]
MTISAMAIHSRVISIALGILCLASIASAQKGKKQSAPSSMSTAPIIVATVGTEKIDLADVERAFQKNLSRRDTKLSAIPRDTALEFLRLYTNYRLKVQDAKDRGLESDSAVKVDLANNRRLLSETFFYDKAIADQRVDQLSRRRLKELHIGIILCAIADPVSKQWDTAGSRRKAERLITQLNAGSDFVKLARDSSDDKETAANGGMLPWISGGSIIKSVEDEAYALKAGQVSPAPVGSRFGYFIVKVFNEEPRDMVKFRHILLTPKDDRDSISTDLFADTLIAILKLKPAPQAMALRARKIEPSGDAFSDLAKAYSDDKTSASKGGYLGSAYSRSGGMDANGSRLAPGFEEAIYKLKDGEISGRVKTLYGTHIMIRDSTKKPDAFVERDAAKRTYRRLYFEEDKRLVLDSIKKVYGYRWVDQALMAFMGAIDTTKNTQDTTWSRAVTPFLADRTIYEMPRGPIAIGQFTDSLRLRIDMRGYTLNRAGLERAINKIADPLVLAQATAGLEKQYPDFAALMQEFNDGILLFKVEEKEVWSKLRFDTSDARVFYDSTKARWMSEQKYNLTEIYVLSDSAANAIDARIKKGEDISSLAAQYSQREGARDKKGFTSAVSPKTSKLAQKVIPTTKIGTVIGPFAMDAGWSIIRLEGIVPPQQKSFEAALTDLAPAYQDALQKRLTEQWLSVVRVRHPVTYDQIMIDKIWGKATSGKSK